MPRGVVLNFHRQFDGAAFEEEILAVSKRYRIVSLPELHETLVSGKSEKNMCHITFDDGESSFYEQVYPVLKKNNWPVSLYVLPKVIESETNFWSQEIEAFNEEDFRFFLASYMDIPSEDFAGITTFSIMKCLRIKKIWEIVHAYQSLNGLKNAPRCNMTKDQVLEVERSGLVTVGAHTQNHPILANESDEDCAYEIKESVRQLTQLLGHRVKYFAYPNGQEGYDFAQREIDYLKEAGIELAFSTISDHLENRTSMYKLPRVYFATTLGMKPSHPYIMWRLALGNRWPRFRKNIEEKDMRDQFSKVLAREGKR